MTGATAAWAWIAARESDVPESLRTCMHAAVASVAASGDPAMDLGSAAVECLRTALAAGDNRAAALHLLAADALLTHGADAAAESDALQAFEQAYGAGALRRRFLPEPAR